MDERERRLAENEALFREVNEHVSDAERAWSRGDPREPELTILCECADHGCSEQITVTRVEYEAVRQDATRFILVRGHEYPEVERIVSERGAYCVVEKTGASRAVVAHLDPRSRNDRAEPPAA